MTLTAPIAPPTQVYRCLHNDLGACWLCSNRDPRWASWRVRAGLPESPPQERVRAVASPIERRSPAKPRPKPIVIDAAWAELSPDEIEVLCILYDMAKELEIEGINLEKFLDGYADDEAERRAFTDVIHGLNKKGLIGKYEDTGEWALGTRGKAIMADYYRFRFGNKR